MKKMLNRNFLYISFLLVLTGILYAPIMPDFFELLKDDNNSHGLFVPFISLYLIWRSHNNFKEEPITCASSGVWLLIISLLLYFIGMVGGVEFLPRIALIMTIISLLYFNLGKNIIRHIYFPLFFLFFMVPFPVSIIAYISLPLKVVAAKIAETSLMALNIPVLREGNMLYFANASLEVADACSGIRSLISFIMLGSLFAYLMSSSIFKKLLLVVLTIPYALMANFFRVTGTGLLAHFFGSKVAHGFMHEFSGIVTFFLGFAMVIATYRLLEGELFVLRRNLH